MRHLPSPGSSSNLSTDAISTRGRGALQAAGAWLGWLLAAASLLLLLPREFRGPAGRPTPEQDWRAEDTIVADYAFSRENIDSINARLDSSETAFACSTA